MIKGTFRNPHDGPEPLHEGLNAMVMTMANLTNPYGWLIEESYVRAPSSLADLNMSVAKQGRMTVWGGRSDDMYACPEHNAASRAWHDSVHWRHQLPFNVAGEAGVVYVQIKQMLVKYGHDEEAETWAAMLLADILGQAQYHAMNGEWPSNQRQFTEVTYSLWLRHARAVCAELADEGASELDAIRLAAATWGKA